MTEPPAPAAAQGFHSCCTSRTALPWWGTSSGLHVGLLLEAAKAANATSTSRVASASCSRRTQCLQIQHNNSSPRSNSSCNS